MASWVGMRATATPSQVDAVARAIRSTPIIDNHAHPLLKPDALCKHPLLAITTEATGDAIHSATTSLPHLRAVRQLAARLNCGFTWESVVAAIEEKRLGSLDDWTAECLSGIETILVDDGLDDEEDVHPFSWHSDYTRSECKRIVRIEKVAADIIRELGSTCDTSTRDEAALVNLFGDFIREFDNRIVAAMNDSDVVGFKSVICYRTGLDIARTHEGSAIQGAFVKIMRDFALAGFQRLQEKSLNDFVVLRAALLITRQRPAKPIQFHTGLGDNDLSLAKASPSHLQEFIRACPTLPIVLLHSGYPFTREAGYLASVYENVYLDIGEVFPCVSQDGQERILREVLELCPWSKILWSTDGHWFAETYLLAIMQMREVFETVLCDYVRKGHIGWRAAIDLVRDVLFKNSNKLYRLGLEFSELEGDASVPLGSYLSDTEILHAFLKNQSTPDFVRICWNDFTASHRMRMIPFRKFMSLLNEGKPTDISITRAVFGLIQNDHLIPSTAPVGEYRIHPDFSSLKKGPIDGHISMQGEFREPSGAPVALCPRTTLQRAVELGAANGLSFLLGFEIEFLLLERVERKPGAVANRYTTLTTDGHAWSVSRYFADPKVATLLRDMVATLEDMGIFVDQVHAESATGQFELVLPPYPPVEAVDTLLHTRDVMSALATAAGFRLTLHPKPFAHACGTASHMHMSITNSASSDNEPINKPDVYLPFYAGILKHLRAIVAFTYSNPASFDRMSDGTWSGGRWVTWGTQNKETALRKIEGSHWELKCMDGLANPFFAAAAVLFAGIRGVLEGQEMTWGDCEMDPSKLTANDRKELGVTQMLPASVEEALAALKEDTQLVADMGPELVERYVAIKEYELGFLGQMGEEERKEWLMERY